jgi:hypothetical protein
MSVERKLGWFRYRLEPEAAPLDGALRSHFFGWIARSAVLGSGATPFPNTPPSNGVPIG